MCENWDTVQWGDVCAGIHADGGLALFQIYVEVGAELCNLNYFRQQMDTSCTVLKQL